VNDSILKGIGFGLFMALSVGPTIFAVLKYSISYGHKAGIAYVLGVSVSDILYLVLANVAAVFLLELRIYEQWIGIAGGILLIIMGLYSYFKKMKPIRNTDTIAPIGIGGIFKIASSGFLMNTLNPSVIITWMGMTISVAAETVPYRFSVFATTLIIVLGIDFLKVFAANKVRQLLTPRTIIILHRISAVCLFAIGVFLVVKFAMHVPVKGHV
jgi:threonine/homoserine/homoserine lactone efflux protein